MMKNILFLILVILVLVPTVRALSVELLENTDQCIFRNGIDRCFSKYLLCSENESVIKTNDIKFIFRDMEREYITKSELEDKLDYEFETEKKEDCYEVSITGWKNPYINIDNVLCYGDICFYKYAWWNTSYDNKIPFYCYCPHCASDTEMLLLASNSTYNMGAYISGSLELFWVNITDVNSSWRICSYLYFNDETDYVMVDTTETYQIEMFIDEGNSTSYGQTEENLTTWLNMKCFGTDCPDSSRYNNSGTSINTTEIEGKIGTARKFNASNTEYITLPYSTPTTTMTIIAWINLNSNTEGQIVNWGNGGGTDTWQFSLRQGLGGVYDIIWGEYDGGTYQTVLSGQSTVVNEWWMVAMQKDGGTVKIFIDGIENASGPVNVPATLTTYTIGARIRSTTDNWFDGIIDNVMVFNRTLSADEIMLMYNNTVGTHNVTQFGFSIPQFPPPPPLIPIHSFIIFKLINLEIPFISQFLETLTFKSIIVFMDRLTVLGNVNIGGLAGTYTGGNTTVCVWDNGSLFACD